MIRILSIFVFISFFGSTGAMGFGWEADWGFASCPICKSQKKPHFYLHAGDDVMKRMDGKKVQAGDRAYFRRSGRVKKVGEDGKGWGNYVVIESNHTTFTIHHLAAVKVKEGKDYNVTDERGIYLGKLVNLSHKNSIPHIHVGQRSEQYDHKKLNLILKGALPRCTHRPDNLPTFPDKFKRPDSDLVRIFKD